MKRARKNNRDSIEGLKAPRRELLGDRKATVLSASTNVINSTHALEAMGSVEQKLGSHATYADIAPEQEAKIYEFKPVLQALDVIAPETVQPIDPTPVSSVVPEQTEPTTAETAQTSQPESLGEKEAMKNMQDDAQRALDAFYDGLDKAAA